LRAGRVVGVDVEDVAGVEAGVDARDACPRVVAALLVQRVTSVLDERDLVRREERRVVEAADVLVAEEEQRQLPGVGGGVGLRELLDRTPTARATGPGQLVAVLCRGRVRVTGLVEEEMLEARAGSELTVLRPQEGRSVL